MTGLFLALTYLYLLKVANCLFSFWTGSCQSIAEQRSKLPE